MTKKELLAKLKKPGTRALVFAAGQSSACKNMSDGTCDDKRGAEGEDPACAAVSSVRNGVSSDRIIGG